VDGVEAVGHVDIIAAAAFAEDDARDLALVDVAVVIGRLADADRVVEVHENAALADGPVHFVPIGHGVSFALARGTWKCFRGPRDGHDAPSCCSKCEGNSSLYPHFASSTPRTNNQSASASSAIRQTTKAGLSVP